MHITSAAVGICCATVKIVYYYSETIFLHAVPEDWVDIFKKKSFQTILKVCR